MFNEHRAFLAVTCSVRAPQEQVQATLRGLHSPQSHMVRLQPPAGDEPSGRLGGRRLGRENLKHRPPGGRRPGPAGP